MQAERWRPTGGRHAARPEGPRRSSGDPDRGAGGGPAVEVGQAGNGQALGVGRAVAGGEAVGVDAERTMRWLRHPATVERVAAVMYESRTGRRWLSAVEVDRIGYLANARAVLDHLAADFPS